MSQNPEKHSKRVEPHRHASETPKTGPLSGPASPFDRKLQQACLAVLKSEIHRQPIEPWKVIVFAELVKLIAAKFRHKLNGLAEDKLRQKASRYRYEFETLLAVAERTASPGPPHHSIRLQKDSDFLEDTFRSMEAFREAVQPHSLEVVLGDRQAFAERLDAFLDRYPKGKRRWLASARRSLTNAGLAKWDIKHLMERVPAVCWPSYDHASLDRIVGNYRDWNRPFRYMRGESFPPEVSVARAERAYNGLRESLTAIIGKHIRGLAAPVVLVPDDSVAWALSRVVEDARVRGKGYGYAGSLKAYITTIAVSHLNKILPGEWDRNRAEQGLPGLTRMRGNSHGARDLKAYLNLARGAYDIAASFFQQDLQVRARVIFEQMIRDTGDSDEVIARAITLAGGETTSIRAVAKTRERMLRRIAAAYFLFNAWKAGDSPGDSELQAWLKKERGLPKQEIPTILHIAALCRASLGDHGLGLPLLSTLLVERYTHVKSAAALERVRQSLDDVNRLTPDIEQRLAAAAVFADDPGNRKTLQALKGEGRQKHLGYFVSPVFCLALLHNMPADEVVETLLPQAGERTEEKVAWITSIADSLRKGGGLDV